MEGPHWVRASANVRRSASAQACGGPLACGVRAAVPAPADLVAGPGYRGPPSWLLLLLRFEEQGASCKGAKVESSAPVTAGETMGRRRCRQRHSRRAEWWACCGEAEQ